MVKTEYGFGFGFMTAAVKLPRAQQRRSKETLRRILDAFEAELEDKTFEEITVGELCKSARCSVGSFYGRVESKEALLDHLRERVYGDVDDRLAVLFAAERSHGRALPDVVREQLEALVDFHVARRGVIRAVIVQARRHRSFAEHTKQFNAEVLARAAHSWLLHREEMTVPDPVIAVEQAVLMAAGYLREAVVFSDLWPGSRPLEPEAALEHLHQMILGYLGCPIPQETNQ